MRDRLLKLVPERDVLPAFPELLLRLDNKLHDPQVNNNEVVDLIKTDFALSGQVLRMANSAFYGGGRREITNLLVALTRIGHKSLREIVYSFELSKLFEDIELIDQHKFWVHSLAVAVFSNTLSVKISESPEENEIAYYAGLMHDVGIMVFAYLVPEEYSAFLNKVVDKKTPLEKQEFEFFGIDHSELGAAFIDKWWPIGIDVVKAVSAHHDPFSVKGRPSKTIYMLNVANAICNNQGIDNGINVYTESFYESAWLGLGLKLEDINTIIDRVTEIVVHSERLLNVP